MTIKFAAIGINHGHIYGQVDCLLKEGAEFVAFFAAEESGYITGQVLYVDGGSELL